ncbi:putative DNA repair protein [Leishmania major strain Friedlin]|uniref:Putative DNA repair protein n=1 Tax=Leishmania major TaxID=5664 RepID=Q4QA20_LEIMA|nr:putative DNA repair protein [Leishmania major strain Friedlin]CAG9575087.1 DNA_repair_protein_-_putative [Leishmania major strain Friedlin]CAJ04924.1 putative DNA repair protein [Leishmania major strain Friedlin]|eukprot:XP_001683828.1 putative DNA repair protein [Leishmania major strain Friedlin]
MSNFAKHPDLTLNERLVWRPAKGKEHVYNYIVQKSPTARARCRKCSQLIPKGEMRVGVPIRHNAGDNGWISAWQHLGCTRMERSESEDYKNTMHGFAALQPEEQAHVVNEVHSTEMPEHLKPLDPEDLVHRGKMEQMAPPSTLLRHLLPYQKEGMGWMVRQEVESPVKGGILADEMGMGKTIQTVGMMLAHRINGPTLVVCPVSSMLQWEAEIKEHVVPGSLSVVVVYRTTKVTKEELESADVVLTTYPMLEQAWRALISEIKVPCPYCELLFIPRQLVVHNKYFCGPRAKKTQKQAKREKHTTPAAASSSRSVQCAETIRKGLRTLHVDMGDEEDAEKEVNAPNATTAQPQRKRGRKGAVNIEGDPGGKVNGCGTPTAKKGKQEEWGSKVANGCRSSPEKANRKCPVKAEDHNDEGAALAQKGKVLQPAAASRGVVGPIGMYQELMREAGRTVLSRWDAARKDDESSSDEEVEDESSEESDSDASNLSYNSAAAAAEEAAAAEQASKALEAFRCAACHFQLLRYPFCPRNGQHHVVREELRDIIERDTGGDDVDLDASIFHSIKWARVILDEAHRIKGRTTSTARSAFALAAEYRWCLTGTPLQNRVGDLYSLLRFLRMRPYAHYYCETEGCSCASLSHPFSSTSLHQCVFCGHGPLQHHSYFNRYILNPINRYGYIGDGRRGMMMLSNDVFSRAMLRRTKVERAADLQLPSLTIQVHCIKLTKEERNFYESLYKKSTAEFDTFVHKGTVLHNYAHIFQLLSRLRQALDNPLLVMEGMDVGPVVNVKGVCGICGDGIEGESALKVHPCRHQFHRLCLGQFLESAPDKELHCPTCFVRINVDLRQLRQDAEGDDDEGVGGFAAALPPELEDEVNSEISEDDEQTQALQHVESKVKRRTAHARPTKKEQRGIFARLDPQKPLHGTKLDAIANYIEEVPKDEKVVVFSQFGSMLDLTQYWLQRRSIRAVKLCGSLTLTQRQSVLQAFLHDQNVRVILISLKAGGEGLNLQVANHVVLTDPWWNPAVEMQAVQRAHRIGQTRPVHAVRFVTEHSVEERMVDLQDKKMLVFEGTIDGKLQSLNKLTEEDLQFLFTR